MKRTLITLLIGMMALPVGAFAAKDDDGNKGRRAQVSGARAGGGAKANVQRSRQGNARQNMRAQSNVSRRSFNRDRSVNTQTNAQVQSRAIHRQNRITTRERANNQVTRRQALREQRTNNQLARREQRAVNREQSAINRETNRNNRIVNRTRNINRNVRVVNNWRGERFAGRHYNAFRNYRRAWHDRHWWHHNHSRIVFVLGGAYFWNSGYWYPAWGYDPGYVYPYDGPIYGYGDLTPDQIVVNVQVQLRDQGYYFGAIDGLLGPQTRQALAAFQADNGLAITSAVDEPTLATMGLV